MKFRRSKLYCKKPWANLERNETFTKKKEEVGTGCFEWKSLGEKWEFRSPRLGSVGWVARVVSLVCVCIYLILTVLGLCCCAGFFLAGVSRGLLLTAVCRLLIAVACLVAHGLWDRRASVVLARGLSSCSPQALEHKLSSYGAQAPLLRGM